MSEPKDRRTFLKGLGVGLGVGALGVQGVAALRAVVPNVSYDAPTRVKLGNPDEFAEGMRFLPEQRLYVFRDGKSLHAVSAICTHLGCTVRAEVLATPEVRQVGGKPLKITCHFSCPCHGSKYDGDGTNVSGPAPRALDWHPLTLAADDGQLVVDLADRVEHDFRLMVT
jgi:cytochrome b6-f complex iron-sulfur subunit